MKEIWKSVKGYPDYEVSNWGGVRSLGHWARGKPGVRQWRKGKVLKPQPNTTGYFQVQLFRKGIKTFFCVHVLVARTFIPNPRRKKYVNHKFGIKADNCVMALEWATKKEDTDHAFRLGLIHRPRGREHYNYKHGRFVGQRLRYLHPWERP